MYSLSVAVPIRYSFPPCDARPDASVSDTPNAVAEPTRAATPVRWSTVYNASVAEPSRYSRPSCQVRSRAPMSAVPSPKFVAEATCAGDSPAVVNVHSASLPVPPLSASAYSFVAASEGARP